MKRLHSSLIAAFAALVSFAAPSFAFEPGRVDAIMADTTFSSGFDLFYAGPQWFVNALPGARRANFRSPSLYDRDGDRTEASQIYSNDVGTLASPFNVALFNNISSFASAGISKTTSPYVADATPPDYFWDVNGAAAGFGGTGTWDTTGANTVWNDATGTAAPIPWANGNNAFFQGTAGTVTLTTGLAANAWTISVGGYTFTAGDLAVGAGNIAISPTTGTTTVNSLITGTASLTKTGGSTLVLTNQNMYSGGTLWGTSSGSAAGIISLGSSSVGGPGSITSGPLGTGTFTVRNTGNFAGGNYIQSTSNVTRTISNPIAFAGSSIILGTGGTGDLIFDGAVNLGTGGRTFSINNVNTTFSGLISNTGSISKNGAGTLILSGPNTYGGGTNVNGGTLLANSPTGQSSTGTGAVIVNSTGTLGGSGFINAGLNNVTVNSGGTITGGTNGTVGTLTLTTASVLMSGTYVVDLTASASDLLAIIGTLNLTSATDAITFQGTTGATVYTLATYTGLVTPTDTFNTVNNLPSGYELVYGPTSLTLVAIPEASTWIGAALALAAIGFTQRRRFMKRSRVTA